MLEEVVLEVLDVDVIMIIGSFMQVYFVVGLVGFVQKVWKIYYVDFNFFINYELSLIVDLKVIDVFVIQGVFVVVEDLMRV